MKPREWKLDVFEGRVTFSTGDDPHYVRVVEHAAYQKAVEALQRIFDETEGRGEMKYPTTDTQPILKIAYEALRELGELGEKDV